MICKDNTAKRNNRTDVLDQSYALPKVFGDGAPWVSLSLSSRRLITGLKPLLCIADLIFGIKLETGLVVIYIVYCGARRRLRLIAPIR